MAKTKRYKLPLASFLSILTVLVGCALAVMVIVMPIFHEDGNELMADVCFCVGLFLLIAGLVACLCCSRAYKKREKRDAAKKLLKEKENQKLPVNKDSVTFVPQQHTYQFVHMGQYQTLDEKFEQISKMDKTQFVIYVAKLFSLKGFQVKLTPVMDNYGIDMIVEKMGVTIGVGCLLANKVMCKEHIEHIPKAMIRYNVNKCMALTNTYFDITAVDFARAQHMSLVDRNVLIDEFIR